MVIGILVGAALNHLGKGMETMDESIFWGYSRDGHCWVPEADCVRDDHCAGVTFEEPVAMVVV